MRTVFIRIVGADDKAAALLQAINDPGSSSRRRRFDVDASTFSAMPRSPFVYWVSDRLRRLYRELPSFEEGGRTARQGLATSDDFRFARAWWEVAPAVVGTKWRPLAKGGAFSPFYADVSLVTNWGIDGVEIKAAVSRKYPQISDVHWVVKNSDYYFRPGITWSRRPHLKGSFQILPVGCIFGSDGPAAFSNDLHALSAVLNSASYLALVGFLMARGTAGGQTLKYETGYVMSVPIPTLAGSSKDALSLLASRAWALKRDLDTATGASHAFTRPALTQVFGPDLRTRAATWSAHILAVGSELARIQGEIDERCFALYGIEEVDRPAVADASGAQVPEAAAASTGASDVDDDREEESDEDEAAADAAVLAATFMSWSVGVAFGRFDVRLATGARPMPPEPEPFDPLPACSPGMLTGDDGLPLAQPPVGYPLSFPESGVLVDDPGHALDVTAAVRAVFDVVFGADADRWWNDVAALLDPKSHDLRVWLASAFFEHHLKRYSKSRRKAPIVWQLGTPSGRYSVWLYAHRLRTRAETTRAIARA